MPNFESRWPHDQAGNGTDVEVDASFADRISEDWNLSFSAIVESINDGVLVCDLEGNIAYVNPALAHMLGYHPEETIGHTIYDYMDEEWAGRAEQRLEWRREGIEETYDHKLRHRDGSEVWGLVSAKPIYDHQRDPIGSLVAIQDITERKKMEEKLVDARRRAEAANQAKSEFLANMSHEIRTPMNGIVGMLDLLGEGGLSGEQREYLAMARNSARGLLQLIDDILDFSKIEARQLELRDIDFSLTEQLGATLQMLVQQAAAKGLELVYHLDPEIPYRVTGDPDRLRQVIINLVKNSIKFTEEGQISVMVKVEEEHDDRVRLQFAVADTGKGVAEEKRDEIFEAFHQEDTTPSRKHGGTGLGLTIARQLVELMDGNIWLESTEGVGTTVYFTAEFGIEEREDHRFDQSFKPLSGVRVLVVDDNHVNCQLLATMLDDWGLEPIVARDGREALEQIEESQREGEPIRIAAIDADLPDISGLKLARKLREKLQGDEFSILLLSGKGLVFDEEELRDARIDEQLLAPVRPSSLLDSLGEVLALDELMEHREEEHREQAKSQPARKLKVLLAEDNPVNQRVTSGLLEKRDHDVVLVENGREAVEKRFDDDFDMILMDVQMPEMDGYEATRAIRRREQEEQLERMPIVALTAHAMSGDREQVMEAGMDDYLAKPVGADELYETVENAAG